MSNAGKRATWVVVATLVVLGLVAWYIASYTSALPTTIKYGVNPATRTVNVEMQTVGEIGKKVDPVHPTWVSYLLRSNGRWVHSTIFQVPAHSLVHVRIMQYDGASGLRNPFWGQVQGTVGGSMLLDGKRVTKIAPENAAHSFAIPQLGVFVPLEGVEDAQGEKEEEEHKSPKTIVCAEAPCEPTSEGKEVLHHIVEFTFVTGGKGKFRWQCFVPCGAGYLWGNGGPMSTLGYMGGYVEVV